MKALMIVESPNKAKKIRGYFPEFEVLATVGHFRDLPPQSLGVEPPEHKPQWEVMQGKQDIVTRLRNAAKKAELIYVATDPDREGEAIAGHVVNILGRNHASKIARITYTEVSKKAINSAIQNSRSVDWHLVRAQEARRVIDRYVGYLVSPELSNKARTVCESPFLSAGRVQSIAVRLVVEREEERSRFKAVEHYGVVAHLECSQINFKAVWQPKLPQGELVLDRARAALVKGRTSALSIKSLSKSLKPVPAPAPLITSSYVKLMASKLRLTTREAMDAAQKLFEAGLITYHRTDSFDMSLEFQEDIRTFATNSRLPVPEQPRAWANKAGAQEGHECLRVTDIHLQKARAAGIEDRLLNDVYRLVWSATLESQLADGQDSVEVIKWDNGHGDEFITRAKQVSFKGWREVAERFVVDLGASSGDDEVSDDDGTWGNRLPELGQGDVLECTSVELTTKETKPPASFTEKTLVERLDKLGIGRPSTYAQTLERVVTVGYIKREKKTLKLTATPLGIAVVHALLPCFSFLQYEYTARIEERFDQIAARKLEYLPVVAGVYEALCTEIGTFKDGSIPAVAVNALTEAKRALGSSGTVVPFNKPRATKSTKPRGGSKPAPTPLVKCMAGDTCPTCRKGTVAVKRLKSGTNAGRPFMGCSTFPQCRFFQWMQ